MTPRYLVAVRIAFVCMLVLGTYLSLTPDPPAILSPYDKPVHATGYLALAVLADFSLPSVGYLLPKGVPLFVYGWLMEVLQRRVPGRSYETLDLVANGTGLLLYGAVSAVIRGRRATSNPPAP